MKKTRISLWSHAAEKASIVDRDGFTLEALRTAVPDAFQDEIEPVGVGEPWEVWSKAPPA
jgi:hypothetical protein